MKKVLSWVLVLALVLSSFTMAFAGDTANSSDMKDAAAIQNVEAVDVMVATGIIGGYPDGYYYPEKAVTRAEMAKMISVAMNGGEDVGAYYANSCTFADSANHWAAGYIAYCANEGIIDGRDANTFDPDATVTGTEAAKMMLVALGYDSKIEGFTGGQWAGNVLKAAKANDLFDGCDDFNAGAALDRDNAAQIIFNGLQADTVEYSFDAEISTGDTTITVNTAVAKVEDAGGNYVPLYVEAFGEDLTTTPVPADDLGRPGHDWELDGEDIGTYADAAKYEFIVAAAGDVEDAFLDYDEDLYAEFDGVKKELAGTATSVKLGDVVEVYDVDDKITTPDLVEYKAVVISYDLAQISAVDTVVSDTDAEEGVEAYVTIDGVEYKDTNIVGYDAVTYVEDAVVAYIDNGVSTLDGAKIYASFAPEKVTGEVTKIYSDAIYIDGVEYPVVDTGYVALGGAVAVESTYDFYLVNGYVYGSVLVEEVSNTLYGVYLAKDQRDSEFAANPTDIVKIFTADGEEVVYVVDEDYADFGTDVPGAVALVAYTVNEDGELDSIDDTVESVTEIEDKAVSSKGIFDGKLVDENVVVFNDDNNDSLDPAWAVYGYDEFAAAEAGVVCDYITNDDGDIIAVYTKSGSLVSTTSTVVGIVTEVKDWTGASSNTYHDITILVEGNEVTYTTVKGITSYLAPSVNSIVVLTINTDSEITALGAGTVQTTDKPVSEFAVGKDYYAADLNAWGGGTGATVSGNANGYIEIVDTPEYVKHYAGDATVYTIEDGVMVKSSLAKIKAGAKVKFYQFDESSEAWDVVIF